jgi:ubiquitin-protein ligase
MSISKIVEILEKKQFPSVTYITNSQNELLLTIQSNINTDIKFTIKTSNNTNKWEVPITDNTQEILSKILPNFDVLDIDYNTGLDKKIKNLIELLEIIKIYNYCFNCGSILDLGGNDKFMPCDKLECTNVCNSRLLDDSVTKEFQKYKNTPNISILEFLIKTAYWSATSSRRDLVYNPNPFNNTWDKLDNFISLYPVNKIFEILVTYETDLELYNCIGDVGYGFIKFTIKTNNTLLFNGSLISASDINKLFNSNIDEKYIETLADNVLKLQQFSVQHPQQVENRFKKAPQTCYLYHGSRQENWYSIMRNGLKVCSDSKMQVNGAVYGSGIYLSDQVNFSLTYSAGQNIVIGVYQVMETREKWYKTTNIYVVPEEKNVLLKYLLIFPSSNYSYNDHFQGCLMNILNNKFQSSIYQDQSTKQSQVSTLRSKRLMKEYKTLFNQDVGFRIQLVNDDNLDVWKIYIPKSGFEGNPKFQENMEKFNLKDVELEFRFNENYPVQPPFVRIVSPRFIYRTGHITIGGSICMELLTNQGWDMTTSISTVITYIKSAIMDGDGQIESVGNYNMTEAVDAYNRMLKSHGWI